MKRVGHRGIIGPRTCLNLVLLPPFNSYSSHIIYLHFLCTLFICVAIYSFIHSGYFYSASSSPLLLKGAPDYSIDTVSELTRQSATGNCE